MRVLNWIRDVLGYNRYCVSWRFTRMEHDFNGSTRDNWPARGFSKRTAQHIADGMNEDYGKGTHWIERIA